MLTNRKQNDKKCNEKKSFFYSDTRLKYKNSDSNPDWLYPDPDSQYFIYSDPVPGQKNYQIDFKTYFKSKKNNLIFKFEHKPDGLALIKKTS